MTAVLPGRMTLMCLMAAAGLMLFSAVQSWAADGVPLEGQAIEGESLQGESFGGMDAIAPPMATPSDELCASAVSDKELPDYVIRACLRRAQDLAREEKALAQNRAVAESKGLVESGFDQIVQAASQ